MNLYVIFVISQFSTGDCGTIINAIFVYYKCSHMFFFIKKSILISNYRTLFYIYVGIRYLLYGKTIYELAD